MGPSKVRKEEADLRKIAKQSRLARKEAGARERKQKQRELRAKAKAEAAGETVPAKPTTSAPRKRQGAIILPDEVSEMHQRLSLDGDSNNRASQQSPSKQQGKKKKGSAKTPEKKTAAAVASSASPSSSSPSSSSIFAEPNHHFEIHYKKKQVFVDVVLHHIPHQKIDVSETTATQLVVDTTKHTKKFRLELSFPHGMRVKPEEAEYELENGVLKCVLPIEGDEVPEALQKEWDSMLDKVREQRALRFRVGKDGALTVRTRQALLAKDETAQAALRAAQLQERRRGRAGESEKEEDEGEVGEEATAAPPKKAAKTEPKKKKAEEESSDEDAKTTGSNQNSKKNKKAAAGKQKDDVFAADHAKAMKAAKAAAAQAHQSIRDRVKLAKTVQAQRQERVSTRGERREKKQERKEASFQRVLDQQRQQLAAKAQLAVAVEEAEKKRGSAKKNGTPSKSVTFA